MLPHKAPWSHDPNTGSPLKWLHARKSDLLFYHERLHGFNKKTQFGKCYLKHFLLIYYNHQCREIKLQKLLDHWVGFSGTHYPNSGLFQHLCPVSGLFRSKKSKLKFQAPWEPCKQNCFTDHFNCPRISHNLKWSGNGIHSCGPAAAKHRSSKDELACVKWEEYEEKWLE